MPIHYDVVLSAPAAQVFELLTDAQAFSRMTGGAPARIEPGPGGAFSLFGGAIEGRTIEAVPATRLVQAWRAASWPAGRYSVVRFELEADGETTRLALDHDAYPDAEHEHLRDGWTANYLEPLKKTFGR